MPGAKAPESLLEYLREQVQDAVGGLANVGRKKLLVSVGWTVNDRTFALVSRQGRVVVRIPNASVEQHLLALDGAEPWKFGKRAAPRGWVQLPEAMNDDAKELRAWLRRAWTLNANEPASPKKTARKR